MAPRVSLLKSSGYRRPRIYGQVSEIKKESHLACDDSLPLLEGPPPHALPGGPETKMKKTPLALVKERFESKEKLAAAVEKLATKELWLDRTSSAKGLARVSNTKLLHLHDVLAAVKKDFGSRDKLIGAILEAENRTKDAGYKSRLESYPLPRLLDQQRAASARKAKAAAKPPAKKAAKKAAKKPAAAKAASA